jgi:CRP-like cAMP-binding protein
MNEIIDYTNRVSPLDTTASEDFLNAFEVKAFAKGSFILKAGQVCKYYYFIKSGLTKSYFYKEEKEFIMTFFYENMMFTEFSSYLTEQPSKYMIMALEDTVVYSINKKEIIALSKKHHCIETLFSKLFSFTALKMMKRISEMLEEKATERYKIFLDENNHLLQRISLGDLSSYLGITQVSLSRIRAGK